jgi:hypothetical protein
MRIFISYSNPDLSIVRSLANQIENWGDVFYWNQSNIPGNIAWEQIYNWIDNSDIVLVLITGNTVVRAMSVGQEVGRAKAMNKIIIPIVSNNISSTELGFLSDITYQPIEITNPGPAIQTISKIIESRHNERVENIKQMGLFLAGAAFLILLSANGK